MYTNSKKERMRKDKVIECSKCLPNEGLRYGYLQVGSQIILLSLNYTRKLFNIKRNQISHMRAHRQKLHNVWTALDGVERNLLLITVCYGGLGHSLSPDCG